MTPTADEKVERRSTIESEHNLARDEIYKTHAEAVLAADQARDAALRDNRQAKEAAFVAEGLNSDGSDPLGRPTG